MDFLLIFLINQFAATGIAENHARIFLTQEEILGKFSPEKENKQKQLEIFLIAHKTVSKTLTHFLVYHLVYTADELWDASEECWNRFELKAVKRKRMWKRDPKLQFPVPLDGPPARIRKKEYTFSYEALQQGAELEFLGFEGVHKLSIKASERFPLLEYFVQIEGFSNLCFAMDEGLFETEVESLFRDFYRRFVYKVDRHAALQGS